MESSGTNQTDQNNATAATSPFAPVDTPALDPMTMNMGAGSTAVQNGATGAAEAAKPEAAKNEEAAAVAGGGYDCGRSSGSCGAAVDGCDD